MKAGHRIGGVLALLLFLSTPSVGKQVYAAYEGADAIQTGTGGAKITENGIDYWTRGTPPRRYQVLGVLTDARKNRPLDGDVVGSKSVAKRTLEAGGNAVIFASQSGRDAGMVASYGNGFAAARNITRTTTELLVIKYLP